jgi:hypothetical protein
MCSVAFFLLHYIHGICISVAKTWHTFFLGTLAA